MEHNKVFAKAYWHEWSPRIIENYAMKRHGKEWKGPCPICGGVDRFWIKEHQNEVKVHCRHGCDFVGIIDELKSSNCWPNDKQSDWPDVSSSANPFDTAFTQKYHERKGVQLNGAMVDGDNIVIRIINAQGENVGTQSISPDGKKRFTHQMVKEAAFSVINGPLDGLCYVTEGWATGASVSEATGRPVIFALDAGNLPKVVKAISDVRPGIELIVAGDNDDKGIEACIASGLPYVIPEGHNDFNDVHAAEGIETVSKQIRRVVKLKSLFSHIGELELREPEWYIEGILEKQALAAGFGAPAAGKTFVMLDMALSIASGTEYHGHAVEQGTVFYIAGEGHNGFVRRCRAWAKAHDVDLTHVPFFKSNKAVVMNDIASVELMHKTITDLSAKYGKPSLVVIDTVARSMGGDENSTKDMNEFIKQVDRIKDNHECTVLLAHHTGVATKERARGSSALLGALDCEFRIERFSDNTTLVEFTKMKDAPEPAPMAFIKVDITLLTDDMNEVSSIYLDKITMPSKRETKIQDVIKAEYAKLIAGQDDKWVSRTVLKANASIECGKSQRTVDRDIKRMIDVQEFKFDNNKLLGSWTS